MILEILLIWFIISIPVGITMGMFLAGRMGKEEALLIALLVMLMVVFTLWVGPHIDQALAGLAR
jgi:hypothetical protein